MGKLRTLFVTPVVPLPPLAGGTRTFHILKALSELGELDLVCLTELSEKEKTELSVFCRTIVSAPVTEPTKKTSLLAGVMQKFIFLFPFLYSGKALHDVTAYIVFRNDRFNSFTRNVLFYWLYFFLRSKVKEPSVLVNLYGKRLFFLEAMKKLSLEDYQILCCDLSYIFPFFQKINGPVASKHIIINTHNVEFDLISKSGELSEDPIEKKWHSWQSLLMREVEAISLASAATVFCCSIPDKEKLLQVNSEANAYVIPNGVDISHFKPFPSGESLQLSLLFTGTMSYFPNEDAVEWFTKDVITPLQKMYPELIFIVTGRDADKLKRINNDAVVEFVSSPEDMRPYFADASIVVVPLRQGSGTRLKILEAAAMQKPVISTRLGAEGLEGLTGDMIRLADTASEFIQSIKELIEDRCLREKMAANIHQWAITNYSWDRIREEVKVILK